MSPDPVRLAELMAEAIAANWFSNGGALHMQLEQALTRREAASDAASLTSSGTMALMLALGLGNLPLGSEVITTPLSFAATAQAIAWSGLRPVFADVDAEMLTLCPRAVQAAITPRTSAILPVHFLGVPCDVAAMAEIAKQHGLWLVYDAAHAFDVSFGGQPLGHYGDAAAFSLHATKILHTGEGGYVVTRRGQAQAFRRMRNFGLEAGKPVGMGLNGKLSELQAALGLTLLPDLASELQARAALRRSYDAALGGIPGLRLHATRAEASDSLGYYALRLAPDLRARLHVALAESRIIARDHFPILCGQGTPWPDASIVTAEGGPALAPSLGAQVLCLPMHGRVTASDVKRIAVVVRSVMQ
ncbi:aminotransferase DegT/DnrJ/EryC1/StrS family protein [Cypionkella aquatica]|uniref:Aminotransferase DegT/DnrJ/EryC1/StrS family protein n=2 Tax=Cypionkella aquatica TaxID=1756042 RepID=A0AA37UC78_9RHOB|nr:aminotransferase DegT/DnrJ/EryC1/StrS family protein [Cypionkella aquatica]GLS88676.1 aminotransferase DegT/DnrJ/EryC1/StrS family protein [Cypionkella aquatica]